MMPQGYNHMIRPLNTQNHKKKETLKIANSAIWLTVSLATYLEY